MSNVVDLAKRYPRLTAWLVLGVGMVAIISYEARDVGLLWGQWAALIVATIAVAGLCVWIISWEDDEAEEVAVSEPGRIIRSGVCFRLRSAPKS